MKTIAEVLVANNKKQSHNKGSGRVGERGNREKIEYLLDFFSGVKLSISDEKADLFQD